MLTLFFFLKVMIEGAWKEIMHMKKSVSNTNARQARQTGECRKLLQQDEQKSNLRNFLACRLQLE